MGSSGAGSLDCSNSPIRIQNSICQQTCSHSTTDLFSKLSEELTEIHSSFTFSPGNVSKGSCGVDSLGEHRPGLLQQDFRCSKELRRLETSHRSEPLEQDDISYKIQDGNSSECTSIPESTRVDDFNRPEGCLFSCTHPPVFQEISPLCLGGSDSTVSGSLFWPVYSASSVHENNVCSGHSLPSTRDSSSQISGRLVNSSQIRTQQSSRHSVGSSFGRKIRSNSKPKKVRFSANTETYIFGDGDQHCSRSCSSSTKENTETPRDCSGFQRLDLPISLGMASVDRPSCVSGEVGSLGENASPLPPVSSQIKLVPGTRSQRDPSPSLNRGPSRPDLVGQPGQSPGRHSSDQEETRPPTFYRCFSPGLGGTSSSPSSFGPLDPTGSFKSHKSSGTTGSSPRFRVVSRLLQKQDSSDNVRQLDCSSTHQESRGDKIKSSLSKDFRPPQVVNREQHMPTVEIHSRSKKCLSRPVEPQKSDFTSGMVHASRDLSSDLEGMGHSEHRSFRDKSQPQTSSVLLPSPGSSSLVYRLSGYGLGQSLVLRISPSSLSGKSNCQTFSIQQFKNDSHCSSVAPATLVPGTSTSSDRPASETSYMEKVTKTTSSGKIPSVSRDVPVSRLEIIESGFRNRGFSKKAAARMSRPNRSSTISLYQAKWSQFCCWCRERKVNPLKATIPTLVDFLIYLREIKELSSSAIKGYRSALSQIFLHRGMDISSSPEISLLLKNFDQEFVKNTIAAPKWDLNLVLQSLTRKPYEPLENSSLHNLTLKTTFLLALASAKRISELQGLSYLVKWASDKSSATLNLSTDFIAKTQVPGDSSTAYAPIVIPALTNLVGQDDPDNLLCPLRALECYLRKTSPSRPHCPRLFVSSYCKVKHKNVTKNTISLWIRSVIRSAYQSAPDSDLKLWKVSSHEVRALATSLLFKHNNSLKQVMSAASWRSNSTFASFYLRDINHSFLDTSSVGPVVAAQAIVDDTPSSSKDTETIISGKKKNRGRHRNPNLSQN